MLQLTRRRALTLLAAGPLAACAPPESETPPPEEGSLEWALAGAWRTDPQRDSWRHPLETLQFWGIQPAMTVLEVFPGLGWYTAILAPYLAKGGGKLIVAGFDPRFGSVAQRETLAAFDARFGADPALYGRIEKAVLTARSAQLTAPGSVDLAILANNTHTLMAAGYAEKAFRDIFAAVKPGGVLGVEQHRAPSTGVQDPLGGTGYVQEVYVRALAEEAGFVFVAASDVNANPADDREHPFGVWTLPPTLRTSPLGQPEDPLFDTGPYEQIGESDRMTLKFRKPGGT
ncbi:MAG: methyltransferase [Caulobacterales bacterium]